MIIADMNSFSSAWIYWNRILDTKGGPHLVSPSHNDPVVDIQQPLVIVDSSNASFALTGAFYALAHFGRYVTRGMARVQTKFQKANVYIVAFYDELSGRVVVNCVNDAPVENELVISDSKFHFRVSLDPVSITTLQYTFSSSV